MASVRGWLRQFAPGDAAMSLEMTLAVQPQFRPAPSPSGKFPLGEEAPTAAQSQYLADEDSGSSGRRPLWS